jgi:hypothetical protein
MNRKIIVMLSIFLLIGTVTLAVTAQQDFHPILQAMNQSLNNFPHQLIEVTRQDSPISTPSVGKQSLLVTEDTIQLSQPFTGIWGMNRNPQAQGEFEGTLTPFQIQGTIITKTGEIIATLSLKPLPVAHLRQTQRSFTGTLTIIKEEGMTQTYKIKGTYARYTSAIIAFWATNNPTTPNFTPSNTAVTPSLSQGWFYGTSTLKKASPEKQEPPTLTHQQPNSANEVMDHQDAFDTQTIRTINGQWGTQNNPQPDGFFQGTLVSHSIRGTLTLSSQKTATVTIKLEPRPTLTIKSLPFTGTIHYPDDTRANSQVKLEGSYFINGNHLILFWRTSLVPTTDSASVTNTLYGRQGWFFGEVSSL